MYEIYVRISEDAYGDVGNYGDIRGFFKKLGTLHGSF